MKPPSFEYFAPTSVTEALALLAQYGDNARPLAGGQSLVPLMNLRLTQPSVLVDLNRVPGLDRVGFLRDGGVAIGAMTRQHTLERWEGGTGQHQLLIEACGLIGHLPIRHRGTIGGNLAHADPASELPSVMLALEAQFELASAQGRRTLEADEFFRGPLSTALRPDELLTEIRLPGQFSPNGGAPAGSGSAFVEIARRHGDFALAGAAAVITLDQAGRCQRGRLALCGVGPTPIRAREAEQALIGEIPTGAALEEAVERAAAATDPSSDVHASASFRRRLARVCAGQAIQLAAQRASEG